MKIVQWIWVVLVVATIRVCVPVIREPLHDRVRWAETINTAYTLHKFSEFGNPFPSLPTGPSAHVAPAFPTLVAGIFDVFGDGPDGSRALAFTEALAMILEIALLPILVRALGGDWIVGILAALFAIAGARRMPESEANYVALLLTGATLLACYYSRALAFRQGKPASFREGSLKPWRIASVLGILWGIILLTNPATVTIWLPWLILGFWYSWRHGWRFPWAPALILPLVLIVPWVVRNYRVLGGFVPVRSNLGLELRVGNNPCAAATIRVNSRSGCYQHPSGDIGEAHRFVQTGEIKYNRIQMVEALAWIRQNPRHAASLALRRAVLFWFPSESGDPLHSLFSRDHLLWTYTMDLATLLSLPGLILLYRRNPVGAVLLGVILGVFPLIYYATQYDPRYRYPIAWVSFVLAAFAVYRPASASDTSGTSVKEASSPAARPLSAVAAAAKS